MHRRQQVRFPKSTRPHRRLGDRLPGVAGISMSAVGGYFLAQFFAGYMNANYGEGYVNPVPAARENTLTDPGYELGTATATFALLTLSIAVPPLYDWLMAKESRLRSFIAAIYDYCSSCGGGRAYDLISDDDSLIDLGSTAAVVSWHHTAEGKLTLLAYMSNVLHVALRIGSAASFAGIAFSTIAVQPMANQFIPFELSADDDQNPEIVARAQTLAAQIGLPVIVVAQFLAALPAWATLLTYTEEPAIYPKQGTFFDKLCFFNAIFSDLFVIHRAKQNGSELPIAGNDHYQSRQLMESVISESEMQLITEERVKKRNTSPPGGATSVSGHEQRRVLAEASQHTTDKTGSLKGRFTRRKTEAQVAGTPFTITQQTSVGSHSGNSQGLLAAVRSSVSSDDGSFDDTEGFASNVGYSAGSDGGSSST